MQNKCLIRPQLPLRKVGIIADEPAGSRSKRIGSFQGKLNRIPGEIAENEKFFPHSVHSLITALQAFISGCSCHCSRICINLFVVRLNELEAALYHDRKGMAQADQFLIIVVHAVRIADLVRLK